jgi:hypothetical protein
MDDDDDWQREGDDAYDDDGWDSASDHGLDRSGQSELAVARRASDAEVDSSDADITLLKEKLASIPQSLHEEGFNALKEILDFLETEDLQPKPGQQGGSDSDGDRESRSGSDSGGEEDEEEGAFKQQSIEGWLQTLCTYIDEDWETVIDNHFTGFNYCIKSFSHVVKPKVGDTLEQLKLLKQKLDKAKLYAGSRTTDLKDKHLKRIQHTEILRILDCVEELSGVLPQLDALLRRRAFLEYVRRLNWALKTIMGEDMANIGALAELREQLLERKNSIHQILLDQLQNLIFVRQLDDPQMSAGGGGGGIFGGAGSDGVDYLMVLSRRDVLPRLAPSTVSEQYHSVRRQLAASGSASVPKSWTAASGARAARDDTLLKELTQALDESLVAPIDVSYERIVRALKVEIKRMLHESADIVGAQERARREHEADRRASMAGAYGADRAADGASSTAGNEGPAEDGLQRPSSQGLVTLMEMAHQMYIVVFFNLVRFSSMCEQLDSSSSSADPQRAQETRMYALAETWRDMQNTVELFVLKHLREPMAAGEGTYTTQELFSGTFSSKLSFSFNSVHTQHGGGPMSGSASSHENEDYAGSDFVRCSPYHMMAIYMPMQEFAEAGLSLLTATGMDLHLARGSHLLPTFLDDFITHTFLSQIVEDSNRLCSVATQAVDAFKPPPTPSRAWRQTRAPLQSCLVVTRLIETLYQCMRAIPTHADLFLCQVTNLITRFASECRRQVELGSRYAIAFEIVCPTKEAAAASAAALGGILQSQSNRTWRQVLRERELLKLRSRAASNDGNGGRQGAAEAVAGDEKPEAFSEIEALSGALFNSEFAALSAALHEHEQAARESEASAALAQGFVRSMSEGQCTLLANVVDALAFLCEKVGALEDAFLQSGALAPELVAAQEAEDDGAAEEPVRELTSCLDEPDQEEAGVTRAPGGGRLGSMQAGAGFAARSVAGRTVTSYTSLAQKTMLSALRSGASIVGASGLVDGVSDPASSLGDDLEDLDELDMDGGNGSFLDGAAGRGVALARCWALHDRFLLVLRTELRCQCFFHLQRTRDARYDLRTAPVNPEEFVVAWNRALERLNVLIKTYLPPAKHAFVLSGLPSTMAAILTTYSGVDEGEDVTAAGVMQMRRNIFALQNLVKVMHVGNPALQAEDVFLDTLMRKLVAHHDKLTLAATAASPAAKANNGGGSGSAADGKLAGRSGANSQTGGRLKAMRMGGRSRETKVVSDGSGADSRVRSAVAQATNATGRLASGTVRRLQGGEV